MRLRGGQFFGYNFSGSQFGTNRFGTFGDPNFPPSTVYVNNTWTGLTEGAAVTLPDSSLAFIGYNAWANLQNGIDKVTSGGTVIVMAGTHDLSGSPSPYAGVDIGKPLTLTSWDWVHHSINTATTLKGVFTAAIDLRITSPNVTVQGLTFDFNDFSGTQTRDFGGIEINGNPTLQNVHIVHNVFHMIDSDPVSCSGDYTVRTGGVNDVTGLQIDNNTFLGDGADGGLAIFLNPDGGSAGSKEVKNNTLSGKVFQGINIDTMSYVTVSGNTLDSTLTAAGCAFVGLIRATVFTSGTLTGITVSNNTIGNSGSGGRVGINVGQWNADTITGVSVTGNSIRNTSFAGIQMGGGEPAPSSTAIVSITSNTIRNNSGDGVNIGTGAPTLTNNSIYNNDSGVSVSGGAPSLTDNLIRNNTNGFDLSGGSTIATTNTIINNGTGVQVEEGFAGTATFHFNRIVGNTTAGMNNQSSSGISAENNWWGCNAGPNNAGEPSCGGPEPTVVLTASSELCDTVSGAVSFNPWLILQISATSGDGYPPPPPATINQCQVSDLTADLTFNSDCAETISEGHVPNCPNCIGVTFGTDLGSVSPGSANLNNGIATATLYPGCAVFGTATPTATVDNETVSTTVIIQPSAPWVIRLANLRANLHPGRHSGFLSLQALINDNDTVSEAEPMGDLAETLLANRGKVRIYDSAAFDTGEIPLTGCKRPRAGGVINCHSIGSPSVRASFTPIKALPFVYTATFVLSRIPSTLTGTGSHAPHPPFQGRLLQDNVCRFDCIDSVCRAHDIPRMTVCRHQP